MKQVEITHAAFRQVTATEPAAVIRPANPTLWAPTMAALIAPGSS